MNLAASPAKVVGSDGAKLFFTCLDANSSTESARWYQAHRPSARIFKWEKTDAWYKWEENMKDLENMA